MNSSGYIENGVHCFSHRVYYSDTDAGGVVYHAKYLDMAEHARTELLRLTGENQMHRLSEAQEGFVVQSLSITFRRPALLDDLLTIRTRILKKGVFSMTLEQEIMRGDELIAAMEIKVGYISLGEGKPKPIPGVWRELSC